VIADPERRGRALAEFALAAIPRLWRDVAESGGLAAGDAVLRSEWECFALYACVRGLVGAGGFNRETASAIDAMHAVVLERWSDEDAAAFDARRARVAERYAEYGGIGQAGGAAGAATVTARLGAACARHLGAGDDVELGALVGAVHEALVEGAAEAVRIAE